MSILFQTELKVYVAKSSFSQLTSDAYCILCVNVKEAFSMKSDISLTLLHLYIVYILLFYVAILKMNLV